MRRNTQLTTGEAAQLLGVSRPTVVKFMEDGVRPFSRPNSSRRIALHDVLAYKQQCSRRRREALDEMTAVAVDMGVYDEAIGKVRGMISAGARPLSHVATMLRVRTSPLGEACGVG